MKTRKLLTRGNAKIVLSEGQGVMTWGMHLAPSDLSGFQVCASASAGCRAGCLHFAGRAGIVGRGQDDNAIIRARVARTQWYFLDRPAFLAQLVREVEAAIRCAERASMRAAIRLNLTSDVMWERVPVVRGGVEHKNIMSAFPDVMFYDYTKHVSRMFAPRPANYVLTFSRSEANGGDALRIARAGHNVAVVFDLPKGASLPSHWHGIPVIDGDMHDARFLDPRGVVVGLRVKGRGASRQAAVRSGFALPVLV